MSSWRVGELLLEADEDSVLLLPDHQAAELHDLLSCIAHPHNSEDMVQLGQLQSLIKTLDLGQIFSNSNQLRKSHPEVITSNSFTCPSFSSPEFLHQIPEVPDIGSAELFDPEYLDDIEIGNEENSTITSNFNANKKRKNIDNYTKKQSSRRRTNILSSKSKKETYSCNLCGQLFTEEILFTRHKKCHLKSEQICNVCGKFFKKMFQLQNHVRIHTGDKPFICHTCGKAFNQETTLRTHLRIHTGAKPFKCDLCEEAFVASNALVAHKLWKHNDGFRPFLCSFCSKSFPTKAAVKKHETIHKAEKKHVCTNDKCTKKFARADHLKSHMKTHQKN